MDELIFTAVMDRITKHVPAIRWVDLDFGQLYVTERPPVAFPCALVDLAYDDCETLTGGTNQKVAARIILRVGFRPGGATNSAAPEEVRVEALKPFRVLRAIHKALQWWRPVDTANRLKRRSCRPEQRADGLKSYVMIYECSVLDQVQDQPG